MATFGAFYDANVLYPSGLRNFLMYLALTGMFRAHWSADVHQEWIRNLLKNRPDLSRDKLNRTRHLMDMALPTALVTGYEDLMTAWLSGAGYCLSLAEALATPECRSWMKAFVSGHPSLASPAGTVNPHLRIEMSGILA